MREYWVGTDNDPEMYGPYSNDQAARSAVDEHQAKHDSRLSVTNSDDAY